jgi:predicted acetyltransferase
MMAPQLLRPCAEFKDSYLSLLEEIRQSGEPFIPFPLKYPPDNFPAFLARLEACAQGSEMAAGFVAHQTYWLVDKGGEVLGASNLRLSLTPALRKAGGHIGYGIRPSARRRGHATLILQKTLQQAKERGILRALITCHKKNLGSAKAILKNGGVLESEELMPGDTDVLQRYWISN